MTAQPVRLQLSRKRGFDLQAWSREVNGLEAMKVDRSTGLGNPFRIRRETWTSGGVARTVWVVGSWSGSPAMWIKDDKAEALDISIRAYRAWAERPENAGAIKRARGKNLACWCKGPCHADVLLELANGGDLR